MKEIEKEVNRIYPNAQVVFLVYSLDTPKLETKNTKIIELDTSLLSELFSNPNYLASDGGHPNRNAWEKIVPILINKVGMK